MLKYSSAEEFTKGDGVYRFPFEVLDKTPGGSNIGRIEWCFEPIRTKRKKGGRYYIEKIYVWAKQTRDKRYQGKIFEIPCYCEAITGDSLRHDSLVNCVWYMGFCDDHGGMFFMGYPKNNHSVLEVNVFSSISVTLEFK